MNGAAKLKFRFPAQILLTLAAVGAGIGYPLAAFASAEVTEAVIAGIAMSVLNAAMGYAAIEYSFNKSYTHFVQVVLGGITLRLIVMVGLLLVLIGLYQFHPIALVGSLFGMYVIFLTLEVLYIHNKWQQKIQNS